jgi:hypothetical protein
MGWGVNPGPLVNFHLFSHSLPPSYSGCPLQNFFVLNVFTLSCKLDHFVLANFFPIDLEWSRLQIKKFHSKFIYGIVLKFFQTFYVSYTVS